MHEVEGGGKVLPGMATAVSFVQDLFFEGFAKCAGAGQGIGRAFAHALGEAGAAVAVVDINPETAQAVASELGAKGVRAISLVADVTSTKECQRCPPPCPPSSHPTPLAEGMERRTSRTLPSYPLSSLLPGDEMQGGREGA